MMTDSGVPQGEGLRSTIDVEKNERVQSLIDEIRKYGVEPDFERYVYDSNSCSYCGQPVLIIQTRERSLGYRSDRTSCEYCMQRLSKRTKAKQFKWVFLEGWRPQ